VALDPYTFTRDAFLQRRRSAVYDGNPPDEVEDQPTTDNATKAKE
jgi:phospholipid-binding lipoprotein MlaA